MFMALACLIAGVIPGWALRKNKQAARLTGLATMFTIYALLFILGAKLGGDRVLFASLKTLGLQGLVICMCCTMGSVFCVMPLQRFFGPIKPRADGSSASLAKGVRGSLYILSCFCIGLAVSRFGLLPQTMYEGQASIYILWCMLFCVGMGIGFDLGALRIVRDMGLRVVLVPALAMLGTAIGAAVAFIILPGMEFRETLAVGAGFGYYSLSSVVISEQGFVALGSISLIANVIRELFTLLATPLLARLLGPLAPVAAAGAPGMDTCLPVIVYFTDERYGIISLFNGLVMTMLVPFLIPLTMLLF